MKSFLTVIILCLSLFSFSQQTAKQAVYATANKADTVEVRHLLNEGKTLEKTKPDSAISYYKKATALAFALKNANLLASCMAAHIGFLNNEAKFEDALAASQQHINMATALNNSYLLMNAYNDAANEYEYLGDYQPSTEYYLKALKLATDAGNKGLQRKINNNLGSVFLALKDYGTGYFYSSRAYQMAQEEKDTTTMGNCLVNMGIAELYQKKYQPALQDFDEAKAIGYKIPDMSLVADALSDKGLVYLTTHNLDAAEASYQQQKIIADKYNLPYEKLYSSFQLAMVAKERGNYKLANNYATNAIAIGEKLGTADELMEMYDSMSVIKKNIGDYQSALLYKNKYVALNDSITNQQIQTNIHHLNIQYHTAQKDKQIAEQNLNIEKNKAAIAQKNTWILASLAGIAALAVILVLSLRSYRHKQKLHQQQLLTIEKEHEVSTLKTRMQAREEERQRISREMHDDIGSALTTILYLSNDLKTQPKEQTISSADRIAANASSVVDKMNEIIWSMNADFDSLNDLIAYIRRYCAEFLGNHHLNYHLQIPDTISDLHLNGEQRRNIYLVIKEALHNIVKHAAATEVNICFAIENKNLSVVIHDNGRGFRESSSFGNGLKNMRRRMETIGGNFDISNENGTTIKINCPLHSDLV